MNSVHTRKIQRVAIRAPRPVASNFEVAIPHRLESDVMQKTTATLVVDAEG